MTYVGNEKELDDKKVSAIESKAVSLPMVNL